LGIHNPLFYLMTNESGRSGQWQFAGSFRNPVLTHILLANFHGTRQVRASSLKEGGVMNARQHNAASCQGTS
jgi:hypothetical protein